MNEAQKSELVSNAAWFAAFSVILVAAAIMIAVSVWFVRRKKYIVAVENKHNGVHFVGARKKKMPVTHHVMNPFQIVLVGFFVAAVVMFVPYCYYANDFGAGNWGKAFMAALHGTLRTFVLDGEYDAVAEFTSVLVAANATVGWFYVVWSWLIYVFAPIFATGIILTLFKNALAYVVYRIKPFVKHICVMSELNEKSLALAEDIVICDRRDRSRFERLFSRLVIVFADVFEKNEEENYELVAKARSIGAICVKRDITEVSLRKSTTLFGAPRTRKIYLIGENEQENVDHGLKLIDHCLKIPKYNNPGTEIYVFSCSAESASLIDTAITKSVGDAPCAMKVRRVDDHYNLILKFLWDNSIFELATTPAKSSEDSLQNFAELLKQAKEAAKAKKSEKDAKAVKALPRNKKIHAVIVGLGGYGIDILRTLCWFTQVPGYDFEADVFDCECGREKIKHVAPELYEKNNDTTDGEPHYSIKFHDHVFAGSAQFDDELSKLKDVSVVFCTLGDDEQNIACSMDIRTLFGRTGAYEGCTPKIYTVVYAPQLSRRLTDRSGNDYGIDFIGMIYDRYTVDVIEQSKLDAYGRAMNIEYSINGTVWDFVNAENVDKTTLGDITKAVSDVDEEILRLFLDRDETLTAMDIDSRITAIQNNYVQALGTGAGKALVEETDKSIEGNDERYKFEYNRRSSIARALAVRWIVALYSSTDSAAPYNDAIRDIVDPEHKLGGKLYTEIDAALAKNEHNRWSAYTRSIGYVLGKRNDIFKMHNTLVPFDELPESNQLKDRPIGALSRYLVLKLNNAAATTSPSAQTSEEV